MPAQTVIKLRRDTAANWTSANPVLALGEPGLETDTGRLKFGDGSTAWTALGYGDSSTVAAPITLTGSEIGFDEVAAAKLEAPELTAVQNDTGSIVAKGAAVYISGANGDNALISLAQADTEATSTKTFGLVYEEIPIGGQGYVVTFGRLSGLNTDGIAAGSAVWLSPTTAGGLIYGAPPVTPNHMVFIGYVIRSQLNNGEIFVEVQNGYELSELHDVLITSVATGEVIQWDGSKWVNAAIDALPDQTGANGQYLTTDGTTASWGDVVTEVTAAIVDSAPATLDTLNELAAALGDDPNFATTVTASLSGKSDTGHTHLLAEITDYVEPDSLPDQTGADGQYLSTDGTTASWSPLDIPAGTIVSDTPPVGEAPNTLWFESDSGALHIYYDGTWVEVNAGIVGPQGPAATITAGTVATGAQGSTATVTNSGNIYDAVFDFSIPLGPTGPQGIQGDFSSTQAIETKATSYTLTSADAGKLILNSDAITITVQGLTVGQQVDFLQNVSGQITFAAGAGMTLNSKGGDLKTAEQYSVAGIKCVGTDTYLLVGDLGF